jgi:hypothetical protein
MNIEQGLQKVKRNSIPKIQYPCVFNFALSCPTVGTYIRSKLSIRSDPFLKYHVYG